jgi:hypothetical protein
VTSDARRVGSELAAVAIGLASVVIALEVFLAFVA